MSTFDLERAKAGDPVEFYDALDTKWIPAHFIGCRVKGTVLVEDETGDLIHISPTYAHEVLRIALKKVTVRYRVGVMKHNEGLSTASLTEGGHLTPSEVEKFAHFVGWIHAEWQTAEIPQPDLTDKETR